ncbi:RNA-binding domain-containing protein [Methanothrix sp.]|jgi:ATP-dependent DNA helicase RecG|uniref:RNA-binding domain-containing protein n=1 Tax=Methanothrix sp. TaxID=90426 RepID=UPI0027B03753|nr:ATP-dependent helicase RecG [Euryarchaeota archaeon]
MQLKELKDIVALGEDSIHQFKLDVTNADSLAAEMAAFANSEGGAIFLGVADDGTLVGVGKADVLRLNQLISNAASQHVRSPLTVRSANVAIGKGRVVILLTIPKGLDKPYFDRNGVIWLKNGADKRRVNSKEELRRLFQLSDQFHADQLPTKAGLEKLDKLRFRDFLRDVYKLDYPDSVSEQTRLLQNMGLATDDGKLNLAGVLLFAERPEWIKPLFIVKAIRYPGNAIHSTEYLDTEDFSGSLRKIFDDSLAFIMRNLRKVQAGQGVNSPGLPEIPPSVFEELLVNALIHRDYFVNATIRLFIFDNRIEIISPGHLPNNLTVEKIRSGISNIRNPILVSYVAKGLLPYKGLGSGIKRALEEWPDISFVDDREGCMFIATVHRKELKVTGAVEKRLTKGSQKGSQKSSQKIIEFMRNDPTITIADLALRVGITDRAIKKQIEKLKAQDRIRRIGPDKGGRWQVTE